MFQSHAFCPARIAILGVEPGLIGRRLLAFAAAATLVAAVAALPVQPMAGVTSLPDVMVLRGASPSALRDQAEAVRADWLMRPGVGAVRIEGLRSQRFEVAYSEGRLLAAGISANALRTSLPVDPALSRPGHLALQIETGPDGLQQAADMEVHIGSKMFRLGDVANVTRVAMEPPASTLTVEGQPAARITIIPAR